jgi:hypothetical protein
MTVLSKIQATVRQLTCPCLPKKSEGRPSTSGSDAEGGFEQMVHIYSCIPDSKIIKRGTVLIDPCNTGPNLITEDAMLYVHGQPKGPGITIKTYDGEERMTGGEVELCFSAPGAGTGPKRRYHTKKFHCVPRITDGIDMILNHGFYIETYTDKVPGVLMIRSGQKKETKGKIFNGLVPLG